MAVGIFDFGGQLGKGFAQLGQEHHRVKNAYSHRGSASQQMLALLRERWLK